jgi:hypothetical protein
MPVIRENRTYSIGPVGVARLASPVPSSNGSQAIAQAVSSAADNMADQFFREGAKKAEQFGMEQAASVAKETILAIDPATGAPKAYETPKGFGTIAQDAYQRVVLTRFQSSVEEEIRLKAKELAAVYDGSVERYSAAMSEYIGAMAVNADGQFQTYIQDVGTSYLNATRTAMAIDQINRERIAAAKAQEASIAAGNDALRSMVASSGAESIISSAATPASVTNTSLDVAINDGQKAELFDPNKVAQLGKDKAVALASGQIEYLSSKITSSTQAKRLHAAITSGDLSLIPDGPLQTIMSTLSYEDRKDLEKVSKDFLDDRGDFLKIVEDEQLAAYKAESAIAAVDVARNSTSLIGNITLRASQSPLNAVVPATSQSYYDSMTLAARLDVDGRTEEATAYRKAADNEFNAAVAGVFNRTLMNADSAETDAIERAVRNRNPQMAPPDKRSSVEAIIDLENVRSGVIESFGSTAQAHREDTGKIITDQKQLEAFAETEALIKGASVSMSSLSPTEISTAYSEGVIAIGNSGMDPDKALSLRKTFANSAATANLSNVFRADQLPTSQQMEAMQTYITDGVDVGVLTPTQIEILDNVRTFQTISENPSSVTTKLNDYIQETEKYYTRQEESSKKARLLYDIQAGQANGSLQDVRVATDELFAQGHPELGGYKVGDLISNGSLFSDPKYENVLNSLGASTVMPESALEAFRGASMGSISGDRASYVLRAWNEIRFSTDPATGKDLFSPAVRSAMNSDEIAKLDMMSGAYTMSGFSMEKVQEASNLYDNYKNNPVYKAKIEERLGASLEVFVSGLDGIDGAMPQDVAAITAAALGLLGSSEVTGTTSSGIKSQLEKQLNLTYPNDGNVMNGYGGLRSGAAPTAVLGRNAEQWNTFVLDKVKNSGFTIDGEKISNAKMANLNGINETPIAVGFGAFGGIPTPRPDANMKQIFLQPVGSSDSNGTYYNIMMWRPEAEGGPVALRQEMTIPSSDNPSGSIKVYPVMTLSTKDPDFSRALQLHEARLQVEGKQTADRRKIIQGIAANSTVLGIGGMFTGALSAGLSSAFNDVNGN